MRRLRLLLGISVFWLGLSMLSDGLTTLVLPERLLGVVGEERKGTALGLITFVGLLAAMLVQPVAGALSDRLRGRWGRRGGLALGTALTLAALALFGAGEHVVALAISFVLVVTAASIAQAAQQGFIPDLVPPERRGTAAGLKGFMDLGGALLAFAVLGAALQSDSPWPAVLSVAAVLLACLTLTWILVREPALGAAPDGAFPSQSLPSLRLGSGQAGRAPRFTVADAFRVDLRRHRTFGWLVLARFLFLLGTYAVGRFLLYFVADRLGTDRDEAAAEAGLLLAGLTLVTVLAAVPAGWAADRLGRLPLMLAGSVLSGAGVLLLALAGSQWQMFLFGSLMAVGSAAFTGANWAMTADLTPPEEAGRFFGLANIGTAGAAAAAGLLGPLVDWGNRTDADAGYTALFSAAALAFAGSAVVLRKVTAPAPRSTVTALEAH